MANKYRKKPVVIEAIQYKGEDNIQDIFLWFEENNSRELIFLENEKLFIKTLEGDHQVNIGDYIIKGVQSEFYPCKPDIFEQTYEPYSGSCLDG